MEHTRLPLPESIFGRTCLSTYDDDDGRRFFLAIRCCRAQLFGIDLEVQSLPFQEQDTAVARCATSALWSVFQGTARLFQHSIPTPVQITRAATHGAASRALPNRGLTGHEVANAIKACGLEPQVISAQDPDTLRMTAYAYLRAKIPCYLNFELIDIAAADTTVMGRHAVAVTGFSQPMAGVPVTTETGLQVRALRINKLYVHDDGVGPFSRIELDDETTSWIDGDEEIEMLCWQTSWRGKSTEELYTAKAAPLNLWIPVYHKIRVPFSAVLDIVSDFDLRLHEFRQTGIDLGQVFEWDIFLSTINDFKREILEAELDAGDRRDILERSFPRFLWRAIAYLGSTPVLELVFDATDIEEGSFLSHVIEYEKRIGETLRRGVPIGELTDKSRHIFEWIVEQKS